MAILSTSERKCLLVAAVHSAPVRDVAWRLKEDFLLVSCTDGKLYVWQIETGTTLNVHIQCQVHVYTCTLCTYIVHVYTLYMCMYNHVQVYMLFV